MAKKGILCIQTSEVGIIIFAYTVLVYIIIIIIIILFNTSVSRKFVTNPIWLGSLQYYVRARNTWRIENFFSHSLLRYCPKRLGFSVDGYTMRNQLAVMDHNEHLDRGAATTKDGRPMITSKFSRKTKEWVAYKILKTKSYSYIPSK